MRNLLYLVILVLCACGGSSPPSTPNIVVTVPDDPTECWINLTWTAPTERIDETPLSIDELDFYTIWIWDIHVQDALDIDTPPMLLIQIEAVLISYEIRALDMGTHYFSLTVTDNDGLESDQSNEAEKLCL